MCRHAYNNFRSIFKLYFGSFELESLHGAFCHTVQHACYHYAMSGQRELCQVSPLEFFNNFNITNHFQCSKYHVYVCMKSAWSHYVCISHRLHHKKQTAMPNALFNMPFRNLPSFPSHLILCTIASSEISLDAKLSSKTRIYTESWLCPTNLNLQSSAYHNLRWTMHRARRIYSDH